MIGRFLLAVLAALLAAPVAAQTFPSKPIRIVVGFGPGGGNDIFARLIGQKLNEAWKQQVSLRRFWTTVGRLRSHRCTHSRTLGLLGPGTWQAKCQKASKPETNSSPSGRTPTPTCRY